MLVENASHVPGYMSRKSGLPVGEREDRQPRRKAERAEILRRVVLPALGDGGVGLHVQACGPVRRPLAPRGTGVLIVLVRCDPAKERRRPVKLLEAEPHLFSR